jgi:uncharacterized protein (TIGR00661 family)
MSKSNSIVLYCILNWGFGHAARSSVIIKNLLTSGYQVVVASDGAALEFIKKHVPEINVLKLPDYNITYSKRPKWLIIRMIFTFIKLTPKFFVEWITIHNFIKQEKPVLLISDTRPFCHTFRIPSIYITNQIEIRPFFLGFIHRIQMRLFSQIWIPCTEEDLVGGYTTKAFGKISDKVKYIGYYPNYRDFDVSKTQKRYFVAAVISGPEPARSQLEKTLFTELQKLQKTCVLIRGLTDGSQQSYFVKNIEVYDFLPLEKVAEILSRSSYFVGRSGFSGISIMIGLDIKLILIPTSGQPEQEENARSLSNANLASVFDLENFSIEKALRNLENVLSLCTLDNRRPDIPLLIKNLLSSKK